ncbi:hypothetical protein TNCV_5119241 [Trichonephila clavipes]|nr:hypothetical protein TNCV_5119241 [Trichonephila clavipes]
MAPGPLHECKHMWLQDVRDIPLGCHVMLQINTRDDSVLLEMTPHTFTSAVGAVCRCKAKARLRRSQ